MSKEEKQIIRNHIDNLRMILSDDTKYTVTVTYGQDDYEVSQEFKSYNSKYLLEIKNYLQKKLEEK